MKRFKNVFTAKEKQMHRCLDAKMHSLNNVKDYASMPPCFYASKKIAFTLAKKFSPRPQCHLSGRGSNCTRGTSVTGAGEGIRLAAFTLAEILITLAIIGVVAALTISTLLTTISDKVNERKIQVFDRKLSKGTDLLNVDYGIGPYYTSTEQFVKRLSKHLKIVTICDKEHLTNCFPYEKIQINNDEAVKVKDIESGANFGLKKEDYPDVAGMVLGDGTPMILAWNKNCPVSDPDTVKKGQTTACIKGIYDLNGANGPNKMTKDVVGFGGVVTVKGSGIKIAGLKINKVLLKGSYQPMKKIDICDGTDGENATTTEAKNLGIKYCRYSTADYWAGAVKECGGVNKLPTLNQLKQLAASLYNIENPTNYNSSVYYQSNSEAAKALASIGLYPPFTLWSGEEESSAYVETWGYFSRSTGKNHYQYNSGSGIVNETPWRYNNNYYSVICLE